ncbi:hypothetical protein [Streptomyces montanisoli]|uniref:Uncharacterized protein n=1 Tax=Streptomyces montanisoli TaxID=2798581 RepID=A0A940MGK0_9ACTN|nr:hypothetical protein [Streptomyces montanisoli]MBP0458806.1 hypothetical protein [Streptomyces montanisoli]
MSPERRQDDASTSRRALLRSGLTIGMATALSGAPTADAAPGTPHARGASAAFLPRFPASGLVTNEYAYRHAGEAGAVCDRDWSVTSGSLFAVLGAGWSGVPDGLSPDPGSLHRTGSAVLRIVTRRRDFRDVAVRCHVLLQPPRTTHRTPATDWDGGHLWLRYRSPQELYALSFRRRDGAVVIKRKAPVPGAPAGAPGTYTTLAHTKHPVDYGAWHAITGRAVTTRAGGVRLSLAIDGRTVLEVEDRTPGRLAEAGGVGVRGDNTLLFFRHFTALPTGWGALPFGSPGGPGGGGAAC